MPYKEKETVKKYFKVAEVGEMVGEEPSTIRFWETQFPMLKPKKHKKGYRQFTLEDIQVVYRIQKLVRGNEYTIPGALRIMSQKRKITKHLNWIYDRLVIKHKENRNVDYMVKFKEIINELNGL